MVLRLIIFYLGSGLLYLGWSMITERQTFKGFIDEFRESDEYNHPGLYWMSDGLKLTIMFMGLSIAAIILWPKALLNDIRLSIRIIRKKIFKRGK